MARVGADTPLPPRPLLADDAVLGAGTAALPVNAEAVLGRTGAPAAPAGGVAERSAARLPTEAALSSGRLLGAKGGTAPSNAAPAGAAGAAVSSLQGLADAVGVGGCGAACVAGTYVGNMESRPLPPPVPHPGGSGRPPVGMAPGPWGGNAANGCAGVGSGAYAPQQPHPRGSAAAGGKAASGAACGCGMLAIWAA